MEIGRIEGTTRTLGKQQGYYGLPLRDDWEATQPRRVELIQEARKLATVVDEVDPVFTAKLLRKLADALTVMPVAEGHENDAVTGPETPIMTTAWLPSEGELVALNAGSAIHVKLIGRQHPPIMVGIGPLPL